MIVLNANRSVERILIKNTRESLAQLSQNGIQLKRKQKTAISSSISPDVLYCI